MKNRTETRATVALAPIAILASMLSITSAQADIPGKKLVLSVFLDTPGAASVLAGDYAAAIRKLGSHSPYDQSGTLAADTNLCVAYTMTQQWDAAHSKCDAAVIDARMRGADDVFDFGASHNAQLAIAYSNRAVLNWLQNRPDKAVADVTRARSLAPKSDFVAQNWATVNGKPDNATGPAIAAIQR